MIGRSVTMLMFAMLLSSFNYVFLLEKGMEYND